METANANDVRENIIGIVYFITYIISSVTFILWFRRAYFNLHQRVNYLSLSEGWAAGSWFVPIISLYRPYNIMKELYEETIILLTKNQIKIEKPFSTTILVLWWTFWIITNFLGQFIFRYSRSTDSIDELITTTILSIILNSIGILLAFITIKIIKDYASIEPLLNKIKNIEEANTRKID